MAQDTTAASNEGWQEKLEKVLHQKNCCTDLLEKVEQATGVKRLYIVLGLGVLVGIWLLVGYGSQFLCNFIGFLYPAYASLKAIESTNKDDDTMWLVYWVVYSTFSLVEVFTDIFLFWIPFYSFLKCCFLLYCMAPTSWNGSMFLYYNVIRPFVLRHQKQIDEALDRAADVLGDAQEQARDIAQDATADALRQRITADSTKQE